MTPLVFLIGFCLVMGAIAIARVVFGTSSNPTDSGGILIILGITVLTIFWVALEKSWLTLLEWAVLGICGSVLIVAGVTVVIRRWDESARSDGKR